MKFAEVFTTAGPDAPVEFVALTAAKPVLPVRPCGS